MNSPDEGSDLDRLHPLTEAEEIMWAESKSGERITMADAAARLAEIQARPAADGTEGREYGPADKFREYEVVVLNDSGNVYRGYGMTLARVIADESEYQGRRYAMMMEAGRETPEQFIAEEPDRVVWRHYRVLCVLRPMVGGSLDVLFPEPPSDDEKGGAL